LPGLQFTAHDELDSRRGPMATAAGTGYLCAWLASWAPPVRRVCAACAPRPRFDLAQPARHRVAL